METNAITAKLEEADRLYTKGMLNEARELYEDILGEDETVAWAHSRIGAIMAQLGDTEAAEAALQRAIELDPELSQAHSNLGNLFYARGDYEGALQKYQQAIVLNPNNPAYHQNLHAAYKKLGKVKEAVAALKQSHKLERESAKAGAKAQMEEMKKNVKGRFGCGTSVIALAIASLISIISII